MVLMLSLNPSSVVALTAADGKSFHSLIVDGKKTVCCSVSYDLWGASFQNDEGHCGQNLEASYTYGACRQRHKFIRFNCKKAKYQVQTSTCFTEYMFATYSRPSLSVLFVLPVNQAKIKYMSVSGRLTYPKIFCRPKAFYLVFVVRVLYSTF